MNKPISAKDVRPPKVTTGPLAGSRKIYASPEGHPDLKVPFREIALTDETSFRVYDTSGPYTDADVRIDVSGGLPPVRQEWIAGREGLPGHPVTQLELARAGIVTKEMVYVAYRENLGRERQAIPVAPAAARH